MGRSRFHGGRFQWRPLLVALCFFGATSHLNAQFGPLLGPLEAPQAKSQDELDAYLEIVTTSDAHRVVREVDEFASTYPRSELLGVAFEQQMLAYQRVNDFGGLLRAGEKSLRLEPNNVYTLLTLASAIPNAAGQRSDAATLLNQAERYAQLALQELGTMYVPRAISLAQWQTMQREMEAQAHEALGHIAVKRGNLQLAIAEFEKAVLENPKPNGSQFFRLGVAYAMAGKRGRAESALRHSANLGPGPVRDRALEELRSLTDRRSSK